MPVPFAVTSLTAAVTYAVTLPSPYDVTTLTHDVTSLTDAVTYLTDAGTLCRQFSDGYHSNLLYGTKN